MITAPPSLPDMQVPTGGRGGVDALLRHARSQTGVARMPAFARRTAGASLKVRHLATGLSALDDASIDRVPDCIVDDFVVRL